MLLFGLTDIGGLEGPLEDRDCVVLGGDIVEGFWAAVSRGVSI